MPEDSLQSSLRSLAQIRVVTSGIFVVLLCALVAINLEMVVWIPKSERIYEDMLGSKERLPELTKTILGLYRFTGMLPAMGVVILSGLVAGFLVIRRSNNLVGHAVAVAIMLVLTLTWLVIDFSLKTPLISIIQSMGEKSL